LFYQSPARGRLRQSGFGFADYGEQLYSVQFAFFEDVFYFAFA
jgi:hypothetical protein